SSRLNTMSFCGRYSFSMISTNFLPNEPVPPVTSTTCSDQFMFILSRPRGVPHFSRFSRNGGFPEPLLGQQKLLLFTNPCESHFFRSSEPIRLRLVASFLCHTDVQIARLHPGWTGARPVPCVFSGRRMEPAPVMPIGSQGLREIGPTSMQVSRNLAVIHSSMATQDSILREYLRVLIKRKWIVIGTLAAIFGASLVATLRITPIYDAVGSIAINKTDPMLQNLRDSGNYGVDYYDPTDLDTEVRILRSDRLALQAIKLINLDQMPEFGGHGSPSSSSLALTTDALEPDSARANAILGAFKGSLHVVLEPNTRIIDIHFRSSNKELAARV